MRKMRGEDGTDADGADAEKVATVEGHEGLTLMVGSGKRRITARSQRLKKETTRTQAVTPNGM
jgi:hypothetical protein